MPPRFAYWTIIVDGKPTAFRAAMREELEPTFKQLQGKHPDAVMMWFAKGRLWASPEEARDAASPGGGERRKSDWRPGGEHRDPRARFEVPRDEKRRRFAAKLRRDSADGFQRPPRPAEAPGADRPRRDGFKPHGDRPGQPWQRDREQPPSRPDSTSGGEARDRRKPWQPKTDQTRGAGFGVPAAPRNARAGAPRPPERAAPPGRPGAPGEAGGRRPVAREDRGARQPRRDGEGAERPWTPKKPGWTPKPPGNRGEDRGSWRPPSGERPRERSSPRPLPAGGERPRSKGPEPFRPKGGGTGFGPKGEGGFRPKAPGGFGGRPDNRNRAGGGRAPGGRPPDTRGPRGGNGGGRGPGSGSGGRGTGGGR